MGGLACLVRQCLKIKRERVNKLEAGVCGWLQCALEEVGRWCHVGGRGFSGGGCSHGPCLQMVKVMGKAEELKIRCSHTRLVFTLYSSLKTEVTCNRDGFYSSQPFVQQ